MKIDGKLDDTPRLWVHGRSRHITAATRQSTERVARRRERRQQVPCISRACFHLHGRDFSKGILTPRSTNIGSFRFRLQIANTADPGDRH